MSALPSATSAVADGAFAQSTKKVRSCPYKGLLVLDDRPSTEARLDVAQHMLQERFDAVYLSVDVVMPVMPGYMNGACSL